MSLEISSQLPDAIARLELVDGKHDFLAGSRAIEVHVGALVLAQARVEHGAEHVADIDLSVSKDEYRHLRQMKKLGARVIQHRYPRIESEGFYRVNSLELMEGEYDVWRARWYEPARHPKGIISVEELAQNSEWNSQLGLNVLTPAYLQAQRERSIVFLEGKDVLTFAEEQRLKKDYADLSILRP